MNGPKGLEWVRVGVLLREGNCSPLAREKSVLEALTPLNPSPPHHHHPRPSSRVGTGGGRGRREAPRPIHGKRATEKNRGYTGTD